jgi:hypothetical protein
MRYLKSELSRSPSIKLINSTNLINYGMGLSILLSPILGMSRDVLAQSVIIPSAPEVCDIDLATLNSTTFYTDPNIVTADKVSARAMTLPSLWWTSEQLPPKLVTNWIANRSEKQIYLLVNTQYWNILDYLDRYRTIDRVGRVAQSYGYNLKVCNSQKVALARYTCVSTNSSNPPTVVGSRDQNSCEIWLNSTSQNGLGVRTN